MLKCVSAKFVLAMACVVGVATSGVAFGHGGGHGGGGHGGGHGGHGGHGHFGGHGGHYGGYHHGGYGGYGNRGYGGYGGYGYGGYGGYGYGGYGYGLGYGLGYGYGGYGGYGYGYPYYGYGYGGYYGGYPTYYNYSQPVYSNPVLSQPVYANSAYVGSGPITTLPQMVTGGPQAGVDGGEIVVFSPPTNTQDIQYTLNGMAYSMKPGTAQRFRNDRVWTIQINNGAGQVLTYTLSTGNYKFKPATVGMGLFATADSPNPSIITPPGGTTPSTGSTPSTVTPPALSTTPSTVLPPSPMP